VAKSSKEIIELEHNKIIKGIIFQQSCTQASIFCNYLALSIKHQVCLFGDFPPLTYGFLDSFSRTPPFLIAIHSYL